MADQSIATIPLVSTADSADGIVVIRGGAPIRVPASLLAPAAEVTQTELDAVVGAAATAQATASNAATAAAAAATTANAALPASQKGAASGLAPLGSDSKVPSTYLPSYVDDVIEAASFAAFPATGETGKIYIDTSTTPAAAYRWTGSAYSVIGGTPQYASQAEAVAGTENTKTMTALRVAQAVANKADKLTTVTVSVGGNFDLTEAAHNGRRVVAAVAGVVFVKTTTWSADAVGCVLDVDADGSFSLGSGITVPSGCASSSITAAGGTIDLACVDGVLKSITPAVSSTPVGSVYSYGVTAYGADAGPAIGAAQLAEIKIPAAAANGLKPGGMLEVRFQLGKVGTAGFLIWAIRVGTTYGSSISFANANSAATTLELSGTARIFRDRADPTKLRIVAGHGVFSDAVATNASTLIDIDAGSAFSIFVQGNVNATGDVIRCEYADVTITNPTVIA